MGLTREEYYDLPRSDYLNTIDKIIDDFESRKCENCKHMEQVSGNNQWCHMIEQYNMKYCSEFERKDK